MFANTNLDAYKEATGTEKKTCEGVRVWLLANDEVSCVIYSKKDMAIEIIKDQSFFKSRGEYGR